jgi:hypothetical protein
MPLTLDLPPELESELNSEAADLHLPLSEYAIRLLATGYRPDPLPRNGAELVAYWQSEGVIGSRPDISDSLEHARGLPERAGKRERQ